tara:strand:+ start:2319 stop:2975 length:657 start_codon:yes stop_codon:yes gene_type:complete
MKIKSYFIFFVTLFFLQSVLFAQDNQSVKTDILFLKIQELENEIAELRNKIESQNYLIEKLINESLNNTSENEIKSNDELTLSQDIKLIGVEDSKSKEQVFNSAISALEQQKYDTSFELFSYFVESFTDEEKNPLSYFWLGEISLIKNDLDKSKFYFLELISSYPNHYRVPLAHKKIGDIYLKSNDVQRAKDKYNFVVREYPNNSASSLALQLLKNME